MVSRYMLEHSHNGIPYVKNYRVHKSLCLSVVWVLPIHMYAFVNGQDAEGM